MTKNFLKLARLVMRFAEVKTDKGSLIYDGELAVDINVMVEDEEGNVVAAPDGEYNLEDGRVVVVADGKVAEIKEAPVTEETIEEVLAEETPAKDEKDLRIEELEGLLKDRDAIIEELNAKIKDLESKLNEPAEEALEMSAVVKTENDKYSKISKILNN